MITRNKSESWGSTSLEEAVTGALCSKRVVQGEGERGGGGTREENSGGATEPRCSGLWICMRTAIDSYLGRGRKKVGGGLMRCSSRRSARGSLYRHATQKWHLKSGSGLEAGQGKNGFGGVSVVGVNG